METFYSKLNVGNPLYMSEVMLLHDVPKGYSSIVFEGVINSFNEMFPPARMFPLAVMHMMNMFRFCLVQKI